MYTLSSKIFLVLQKDAPANQPPEAVKATASTILKQIDTSSLTSLTKTQKEQILKDLNSILKSVNSDVVRELQAEFTRLTKKQKSEKLPKEEQARFDFLQDRQDILNTTAESISQVTNIEKPTLSEKIKQATNTYKNELKNAWEKTNAVIDAHPLGSMKNYSQDYVQYKAQYTALQHSLSNIQNAHDLNKIKAEITALLRDGNAIKGSLAPEGRAILDTVKKQSTTYISALDTEIERFGTTTKAVTQKQPEKTRGMTQNTQPNPSNTTEKTTEEAQKEIKKYHANFKKMWREFNEILDPTLRKNPEKGFTETYKKAKAQYYALEKALDKAQNKDQTKKSLVEITSFVTLLRQFEAKDSRVKSILDTFEEQSNTINTSLNSKNTSTKPLRPETPNSTENPESSSETAKNNYLDRIEAGLREVIAEMEASNEKGTINQYKQIFTLMQFGANVGLNDKYISRENAERLKPYKPTLEGIIGEIYLDILKEKGYTYTFEADKKGVKKIVFSHKNPQYAENMSNLMNSEFASYGKSKENSSLFQVFQAGLVYDHIRDIEAKDPKLDLKSLKDPKIFQEKFGKLFGKNSINDARITEIIDSLDKRDEVQTEMTKTMREIEKAVVANGGTGGTTGGNHQSSDSPGKAWVKENINPALDFVGDQLGNGIHGIVHAVHDIYETQEGSPFRQTVIGIAMAVGIIKLIFSFFTKGGLWRLGGTLAAGVGYDMIRKGKGSEWFGSDQEHGEQASGSLTQPSGQNTPQVAATTTVAMLQNETNLSQEEREKVDKNLITPLGAIPIKQLQTALNAPDDKQNTEWTKILKNITDPDTKKTIRDALKDPKQKSGFKNFVDERITHEAMKDFEKTNPNMTLAQAIEKVKKHNEALNQTAQQSQSAPAKPTSIDTLTDTQKEEILTFFLLDLASTKKLETELKTLKLDLYQFLNGYKQFIETKLKGLDPDIVSKIKKSIKIKSGLIMEKIQELKEDDYYKTDFVNNRWIINGEMQSLFEDMNQRILPSAFVLAQIKGNELEETSVDSEKLKWAKKMLGRDLDSEGDFDKQILDDWRVWQAGTNSWAGTGPGESKIFDIYNEKDANFLKFAEFSAGMTEKNTLLDKEDQSIESNAMVAYIVATVIQIVPYAGAVVSVPTMIADVASDEDGTLLMLKKFNIVPEEYRMEKYWWDTILGAVGLAATIFGAQGAVKGVKLTEKIPQLKKVPITQFESMAITISKKMGLSADHTNFIAKSLKKMLGIKEERGIPKKLGLPDTHFASLPDGSGVMNNISINGESYRLAGVKQGDDVLLQNIKKPDGTILHGEDAKQFAKRLISSNGEFRLIGGLDLSRQETKYLTKQVDALSTGESLKIPIDGTHIREIDPTTTKYIEIEKTSTGGFQWKKIDHHATGPLPSPVPLANTGEVMARMGTRLDSITGKSFIAQSNLQKSLTKKVGAIKEIEGHKIEVLADGELKITDVTSGTVLDRTSRISFMNKHDDAVYAKLLGYKSAQAMNLHIGSRVADMYEKAGIRTIGDYLSKVGYRKTTDAAGNPAKSKFNSADAGDYVLGVALTPATSIAQAIEMIIKSDQRNLKNITRFLVGGNKNLPVFGFKGDGLGRVINSGISRAVAVGVLANVGTTDFADDSSVWENYLQMQFLGIFDTVFYEGYSMYNTLQNK